MKTHAYNSTNHTSFVKFTAKATHFLQITTLVLIATALHVAPANAATLLVSNTNDSGAGSLRQAINDANLASGSSIAFNIPATDPNFSAGVFTIKPTSALPMILAPGTIIDGGTQTGF